MLQPFCLVPVSDMDVYLSLIQNASEVKSVWISRAKQKVVLESAAKRFGTVVKNSCLNEVKQT